MALPLFATAHAVSLATCTSSSVSPLSLQRTSCPNSLVSGTRLAKIPAKPGFLIRQRDRHAFVSASLATSSAASPVGHQDTPRGTVVAPQALGTSQIALEREAELRYNLIHGVELFLRTWNEEIKTIPTYVGDPSNYSSEELTVLNQSRHIYGLCKASLAARRCWPEKSKRFLDVAEVMATSYADHFLDRVNLCFNEVFDVGTWAPKETPLLTVNFQAYALGGVAALYQERLGAVDLRMGRRLYNAFHQRFHDDVLGGYWLKASKSRDHASSPGNPKYTNTGVKGYDSVVYVVSSLLRDLATLDQMPEPIGYRGPPRPDYESHLKELGDIIVDKFVGDHCTPGGCGLIVERFDAHWREYWPDGDGEWQRQVVDGKSYTIGIVGHNMQTGWVLLDLYAKFGNQRYLAAGIQVLSSMMDCGYDRQHGGFFNAVKREAPPGTPESLMWGGNKAWWQQCMGMQALMLADMLVRGSAKGCYSRAC
eukprot:jgi/Mesvir1/14717/Mv05367-RA.2